MRIISKILTISMISWWSSCNKDNQAEVSIDRAEAEAIDTKAEEIRPISIDVFPANAIIPAGANLMFSCKGYMPYDKVTNLTDRVVWESSDTSILSFPEGTLQAGTAFSYRPGVVTVKASILSIEYSVTVSVIAAETKTLSLYAPSNTVTLRRAYGEILPTQIEFKAIATFSDQSQSNITDRVNYSSSLSDIAEMIEGSPGVFLVKKPGEVIISGTYDGEIADSIITVEAEPLVLSSLKITPPSVAFARGTKTSLSVTGIYSDLSEADLSAEATVQSKDPSIISSPDPDNALELLANEVGSTVITISVGEVSSQINAFVTIAELTTLDITPADLNIPNGSSVQFKAMGIFTDNSEQDLTSSVQWNITNPIATIQNTAGAQGKFTANYSGVTSVTAEFIGISSEVPVNILSAQLVSIELRASALEKAKGYIVTVSAEGTYTDGNTADLTESANWVIGNSSILEKIGINGDGLLELKGIGVGSSTLRATVGSVSKTMTFNISAPEVVGISIIPDNPSVALGLEKQLNAIATYSDESTGVVTTLSTWNFSFLDAGYNYAAHVFDSAGKKGKVQSVAEGVVKIYASYSGFTASKDFTVTEKAITRIEISSPSSDMDIGDSLTMSAIAVYTDLSTRDVTDVTGDPDLTMSWSETDNMPSDDVASINSSTGELSGLSEGTTTMSALLVSAKFGSFFDNNLAVAVRSVCLGGTRYSYYCWYLSALDQSCSEVCTANGANDHSATITYVGSGGGVQGDNSCINVLKAIDSNYTSLDAGDLTHPGELDANNDPLYSSNPGDPSYPNYLATQKGLGCSVFWDGSFESTVRYSSPATNYTDKHAKWRRVCACDR